MKRISYILLIFFTSNIYSQLDLSKNNAVVKEKFNPRVLKFIDSYLLTHAHNKNTLHLIGGKKIKPFSSRGLGIITAIVNKKEDYIAISNYHKTINIQTFKEPSIVKEININNAIAYTLQLQKGKLYAGLSNGEILVDDISTTNRMRFKAHKDIIRHVKIIDSLLISVSHDGIMKIWNIDNDLKLAQTIKLNKVLTKIAVSSDKTKIAIACFDGSVFILDRQFNVLKKIKPHKLLITQAKFKDNNTLLTSSFDKKIISTNIENGTYSELYVANEYITNFDIDKNRFIYSCRNGEIYYNNLAD